jgi:acetyl-CoA acetyltransferase family protein
MFVLAALRTPVGARGGKLSGWHPADLAAHLLRALPIDPAAVEDVVLGCAMPVGNQGFNLARNAVLAAGWPVSVPGGTVDRQGASGLAALGMACGDVVVAGGVEVMSTTPQGATLVPGATPFGPGMAERFRDAGGLVPAPVAAERLAAELGLDRAALDDLARASHERAAGASPERHIVPTPVRVWDRDRGEVVASGTDLMADQRAAIADLPSLRPAHDPEGAITAGNAAPAADGAAVVLLGSEDAAGRLGVEPLARVLALAVRGVDPLTMLDAAPATMAALAQAGVAAGDLARAEVSEAYAPVPVAWARAVGVDPARVNPAGGGIALGEPTGAVGARLLVTLVQRLAPGEVGVAAVPGIGGVGAAVVVERF